MTFLSSIYPSFSFSQLQAIVLVVLLSSLCTNPNVTSGESNPSDLMGGLGLYNPSYDSNNSSNPSCTPNIPHSMSPIDEMDVMLLQFSMNLEHLEASYFLWGSLGHGLEKVAPELIQGGPPSIGVQKAHLDDLTHNIIKEFAYEEVGHLRALERTVGGIPRPLMDLSRETFAKTINQAFEYDLEPPFDPYRDSLTYMLGSYIIPYMGLTGYVGANPFLTGYITKRLLAGLLGVEAGQDAVIRMYLYERRDNIVEPYNLTVAEFTKRISSLRNKLGMCGIKDEGVIVSSGDLGDDNQTHTNVLSSNHDSISYARTPTEILRVVFQTGDENIPGGFYPKGFNGQIGRILLRKPLD